MLRNMAISIIEHKRIRTTVAKAKALRVFVEPVINRSKNDTTHSRRMVFRALQSKEAVNILFREVAKKVSERPGGYTRILKTDNRLGDNAEMCFIELVDYNEDYFTDKPGSGKKKRTRRAGSGASKSTDQKEQAVDTKQEEKPEKETPSEENTDTQKEEDNKNE